MEVRGAADAEVARSERAAGAEVGRTAPVAVRREVGPDPGVEVARLGPRLVLAEHEVAERRAREDLADAADARREARDVAVVDAAAVGVGHAVGQELERRPGAAGDDGVGRVRAHDGDGDDGLVEAHARGARAALAPLLEVGLDAHGEDRELQVRRFRLVAAAVQERARGEARVAEPTTRAYVSPVELPRTSPRPAGRRAERARVATEGLAPRPVEEAAVEARHVRRERRVDVVDDGDGGVVLQPDADAVVRDDRLQPRGLERVPVADAAAPTARVGDDSIR